MAGAGSTMGLLPPCYMSHSDFLISSPKFRRNPECSVFFPSPHLHPLPPSTPEKLAPSMPGSWGVKLGFLALAEPCHSLPRSPSR